MVSVNQRSQAVCALHLTSSLMFIGYQDSGADIAYVLRRNGIRVVTPESDPDPRSQEGWCFPDTEEGILAAVRQGATHLWANTILFSSHPLQTSNLQGYEDLRIVGPQPGMVDKFDDKACLNDKLRQLGFTLPRLRTVDASDDMASLLQSVEYPIVAKPVRGRGSHGVKICASPKKLRAHLVSLFQESPTVMLEEFLAGEEATLTIMPPSKNCPRYWSLPPVIRFNHVDGIAPYNGVVAVTKNSRVVPEESRQSYSAIIQEAEQVAELLQAASPIRIDIRRFQDGHAFALFDINMKPVCSHTFSTKLTGRT